MMIFKMSHRLENTSVGGGKEDSHRLKSGNAQLVFRDLKVPAVRLRILSAHIAI
jgi:hypothetical protein